MAKQPRRSTPVFTRRTLPDALRRSHALKSGVWGRLNLLAGKLRYVDEKTGQESILKAGDQIIIGPEQAHHVEPLSEIEMRIDFYDQPPG